MFTIARLLAVGSLRSALVWFPLTAIDGAFSSPCR